MTATKEDRVLGPPGCGKTTFLTRVIGHNAQQYGPDNVIAISHTRAAAAELAGRDTPIPRSNIGTMHSFAFHAIGTPKVAEDTDHIREFVDANPQWPFSAIADPEDVSFTAGGAEGDKLMQEYQRRRNLEVPRQAWPAVVMEFATAWEDYKAQTATIDFTDMIELAISDTDSPLQDPAVMIADECVAGDTLVALSDGTEIPIKDIVDKRLECNVACYDFETGSVVSRPVVGWHRVPLRGRSLLTANGLTATEDHPVFTRDSGKHPVEWGKILSCVEAQYVLYLEHENLSGRRRFDAGREVNRSWVATWRRVNPTEPRPTRKRTDDLHAGSSAARVPAMEARAVEAMVQDAADRTAGIWVRWADIQIQHAKSPRLYGGLRRILSGREGHWAQGRKQEDHGYHDRVDRRPGPGSLVHGRRVPTTWSDEILDYRFGGGTDSGTVRGTLQSGNRSIGSNGCERLGHPIEKRRNGRAVSTHRTTHPSGTPLQARKDRAPYRSIGAAARVASPPEIVCNLRGGILGAKVGYNMRVGEVPKTSQCQSGCCSKAQETDCNGDGQRDLRSMQPGLREATQSKQRGASANVQSELSGEAGSQEEVVYCIDVADHHNFFANRVLVHNCQDTSRIQWRLLTRWAKRCEKFVTAGDPDQAIFRWAGADVAYFAENKPMRQKVLEQSYRVPRAVHALATEWIEQATDREPVTYYPRDEDGAVLRTGATYRYPEPLLDIIEQAEAAGKTVMIQASCGYMLRPLIEVLKREGIPFANPWRVKQASGWNPLAPRGGASTVAAIRTFLKPHLAGSLWTQPEADLWLSALKGVLAHGCKKRFSELPDNWTPEEVWDKIAEYLQDPDDLDRIIAPPPACLDWFEAHLLASKQQPAEFPLHVARRRGVACLQEEPRVYIGTCHSFKGAEADINVVFPDLSYQGYSEWQGHGRNDVVRLFYVAITRTRETLYIGNASSGMGVWS